MAPIKFEEHIKDKLNERKIAPSDKAWDKIASTLDVSQDSKKGGFLWYGIAAGFIGLLMISIWYFSPGNPLIPADNGVVTIPKEGTKENKAVPNNVSVEKIEEKTAVVQNDPIPKIKDSHKNLSPLQNKEAAVEVKVADGDTKNLWEGSAEIIDTKIAEVIAQVDLLEKNDTAVTDAELDALLRKAQEDILVDKLFRKDHTVDASALLAEAEAELDKSFRDQIFETLKNGYLKVRTAVAQRNN
ncbi:MAG: hypothetical protein WBG90_20645 [Saonia sp.]